MFVVPYSDINSYARKAVNTTYQALVQEIGSDRYLIGTVALDYDPKLESIPGNALGILIDSLTVFEYFQERVRRVFWYRPKFYSIPKDWVPDYFQFISVLPKPDKARSSFYLPYTLSPLATQKDPGILCQDFATTGPFYDDDKGRWVTAPGTQYPVEMKVATSVLPGLIKYVRLTESLAEKTKNTTFFNLALTKTISIPLSSDLLIAQIVCTDNSVTWDESDLPLIQGKTVSQIMAAPLKSKIAVIGDSSQTFEYNGVKTSGPLIFRWPGHVVQIERDGGFLDSVYRVFFMLLQPMGSTTPAFASRIIYTTSIALIPQNGDTVIIDGIGNINLPLAPVDGFKFTLDDRKYRRLNINRNAVVPGTGETIGLGQTNATIDHLTPLTWDTEDAGSFSNYIYEAPSKNWVVLLTREVAGTAITQSPRRPLIYTTNTDLVAQPYDRIYLNGTGNILLTQIVAERQFIDIEWSVGSTWIIKVICPVGFTIAGVFEDLDINTALTSVTHLRLALKANNDFGVSA
jgi:hypothetical protein